MSCSSQTASSLLRISCTFQSRSPCDAGRNTSRSCNHLHQFFFLSFVRGFVRRISPLKVIYKVVKLRGSVKLVCIGGSRHPHGRGKLGDLCKGVIPHICKRLSPADSLPSLYGLLKQGLPLRLFPLKRQHVADVLPVHGVVLPVDLLPS